MKPYLVWPDGETREFAANIEAVGPCDAAENWMKYVEFSDDAHYRALYGDDHKIVTVAEDKEGSIEERFSVFCDVSITFAAHRIKA